MDGYAGTQAAFPDNRTKGHRRKGPFAMNVLFRGAFVDDWCELTRHQIDVFARGSGLRPLVLLPDDVQIDDYRPFYDVIVGDAAGVTLRACAEARTGEARLLCVDLAPPIEWRSSRFMALLYEALHVGLTSDAVLLVFSSGLDGLPLDRFDAQLSLSFRGLDVAAEPGWVHNADEGTLSERGTHPGAPDEPGPLTRRELRWLREETGAHSAETQER